MATSLRRGAAAVVVCAFGALFLTGPAVAAPPTSVDETLSLYSDDPSRAVAPGGSISFVLIATGRGEPVAQHRTVVLELPAGVTFRAAGNDPTHAAGPCVPDAAKRTVTCTTKAPAAI